MVRRSAYGAALLMRTLKIHSFEQAHILTTSFSVKQIAALETIRNLGERFVRSKTLMVKNV